MRVLIRAKGLRRGGHFLWFVLLLPGCAADSTLPATATAAAAAGQVDAVEPAALFNDVHFHPSNYVQQGITAREYFDLARISHQGPR